MDYSDPAKLLAVQAALEQLPPDGVQRRLLKARMDHRDAVESFRACLQITADAVRPDRHLLNDLATAAFEMQELRSFESFLAAVYKATIRLYQDLDDPQQDLSAVLCCLEPDASLAFHFSGKLIEHPYANLLVKHWVQALPLFVNFARLEQPKPARAWLNTGDMGSVPGLAYCDFRDDFLLLPDPIFMMTEAYADAKRVFVTDPIPWDSRASIAFWRGQSTGWMNVLGTKVRGWEEVPRIILCRIARSAAGQGLLDARLTGLVQIEAEADRDAIRQEGLLGEFVPWPKFQEYKYQIDIDGNTNAWAGLFIKLCSGCPVLKVKSSYGFRQWYYDRLRPWDNFVPVEADMSDLLEKILWLQQHDESARQIGERARQLAISMSEEAELERAIPTLRRAFGPDSKVGD